jgi:hypothetical protein
MRKGVKKHEKILNTIALVVAFVGGLLWATGEWMGALMSLILYVNG